MMDSAVTKKSTFRFILHAAVASFGAYFCMYAFRKPFSVAAFDGMAFWGMDYKILLVVSQVLGYALSKFIGIRVISGMNRANRGLYTLGLIILGELSLVLFAVIPAPYNMVCMFFNGLPLGLIWGVVFSYLEGRRHTELLGLILCSSFILSSGVVKSIGLLTMQTWGVSEFWMPAVTGGMFLIPMFFFSWMLEKIPPPTPEDEQSYTPRIPMTRADRITLFKSVWFPLLALIIFYAALTAFRDFRDNFSRELWDALGFGNDASVYTSSEVPITVLVLASLLFLAFIKNNFKAFVAYHYVFLGAVVTVALSTLLFQLHILPPWWWMVAVGLGLYIAYVPFNCIFFDRMVATFRMKGNAGFLIYIADSAGYFASVSVLLYKNFGQADISWLQFFVYGSYGLCLLGAAAVLFSLVYFYARKRSAADIVMTTK